jgi:hypothetical protein
VAKRSIEEETWNKVDHDLVRLKKDPVARELEQKYENRKTQIYLKGQTRATAWTVPLEMSRLWIEQTKEWIESLNQIYGQVWERQGKVKTPSFVRAVFQKALLPAIETGIAAVKEALSYSSLREHSDDLTSLQVEDIVLEVSQVRHEWQTRIEIEARELQLEQERAEAQQPVPMIAADVPREPDAVNVAEQKARQTVGDLPVAQAAVTEPVRGAAENAVASKPRRGPKPKMEYHRAVAAIVNPYGDDWQTQDNLEKIAAELGRDEAKTPIPKAWTTRKPAARRWERAVQNFPELVVKTISYSLKMAARVSGAKTLGTLANSR